MKDIFIIDTIDQSKSELKGLVNLVNRLGFLSKEIIIESEELFLIANSLESIYQKLLKIEFNKAH
ncbi:TPA: hypothetical protein R4753_001739 [Campylobacter jejuni]|nr:hypothetical protein [Campylobacter jejuni]HED4907238.1 hypothetical protein [Campylobacter jejuni]HED4912463.1 hypothetical protein [Campylobacter jejuni]